MTGCEERVLSTIHDSLQEAGVPLIGASAYGVLLGEKHCVILDGKVHTRSCAYAFIKTKVARSIYIRKIFTNGRAAVRISPTW